MVRGCETCAAATRPSLAGTRVSTARLGDALQVPGLDSLNIPKYAGEVMAPFSEINKDLAFVPEMLSQKILVDGSL